MGNKHGNKRVNGSNERALAGLIVAGCCSLAIACGHVEDSADVPAIAGNGSGIAGASVVTASAGAGASGGSPAASGASGDVGANGGASSTDPPSGGLVQSYDRLRLEVWGGYGPEPCSNGKDSYEVTRVPGHLTWAGCDWRRTPAEPVMGDRPLSEAEVASVTEALGQVSASSALNCGADASIVTLDVTSDASVALYADDFYSGCPWDELAGRTFVTGLGSLMSVLTQLVGPLPSLPPAPTEPQLQQQAPREEGGTVVECLTVSPGIATGRAVLDGPLCFGLSYGALFQCAASSDGVATCTNKDEKFVVVWASVPTSVAPYGTAGKIYDELGGNYLALVFRSSDETYVVDWGNGELDVCQPDLTDFCSHRPK